MDIVERPVCLHLEIDFTRLGLDGTFFIHKVSATKALHQETKWDQEHVNIRPDDRSTKSNPIHSLSLENKLLCTTHTELLTTCSDVPEIAFLA